MKSSGFCANKFVVHFHLKFLHTYSYCLLFVLCMYIYKYKLETVNTNQNAQWVELHIIDRV